MHVIWGLIVLVVTSIAWVGQVLSAFSPSLAVKLGVMEPASEVDPTIYLDIQAEAVWDAFVLWTLPLSGVLLLLNSPLWVPFGLVGGSMYLYFAGRGIAQRVKMQRAGIRFGTQQMMKGYYAFLIAWGLIGTVTMVAALMTLVQS